VVVTAHHDGLGIGKHDTRGDSIYNGANDNAVGVALAICLARELGVGPSRRGVMVILTAAEERGHLGARYWAEHPTIEIAKVKFAVNFDAIGVTGPTLDFIAYGNGQLTGADSLLRAAGAHAGFELATVSFESSMYWAFDSAELGAAGIPAVTIGQGTQPPPGTAREPPPGMPPMRARYHSPSDEVAADWDPAAIRRYAELGLSVVEAARTHTGDIRLRVPNAYQTRP
jgi:Zn-dependent M28 family amino/carboxypeptidase